MTDNNRFTVLLSILTKFGMLNNVRVTYVVLTYSSSLRYIINILILEKKISILNVRHLSDMRKLLTRKGRKTDNETTALNPENI